MTNLVEISTIFVKKMMKPNAPAAHSKLTQKANLQEIASSIPTKQISGVNNHQKFFGVSESSGARKNLSSTPTLIIKK